MKLSIEEVKALIANHGADVTTLVDREYPYQRIVLHHYMRVTYYALTDPYQRFPLQMDVQVAIDRDTRDWVNIHLSDKAIKAGNWPVYPH